MLLFITNLLPFYVVGVFNLLQETGSEPLNLASLFQQNEDEMGEFTGKNEFLVNFVFKIASYVWSTSTQYLLQSCQLDDSILKCV